MRWRYLFLGLFVAVPIGTFVHVWPQMPAYCIPGGREYLADDPAQRQLLFIRDERNVGLPPVVERYDSDSGRMKSEVQLDAVTPNPSLAITKNCTTVSGDLQTICVFDLVFDEPSRVTGMTGSAFNARTGGQLCGRFSFGQFDRKGLSPNGKWFALVHGNGQLVVIDTRTSKIQFEASSPTGKYVETGVYFSPDSRFLLYQWHVDGESGWKIHLVNLETGQLDQSFSLPHGRKLCEWRANELRTRMILPRQQSGFHMPRFRHSFDGKTLGEGVADPLLDCTDWDMSFPGLVVDTESWVTQVETYPPRKSDWSKILEKCESLGVVKIFGPLPQDLSGCVRIVDRTTGRVRFEKHVPEVTQCRLALDGKLLIIDTKEAGINFGGTLAPPTSIPPPPPFEIYRTDVWPRWIWTTLCVFGVMAVFALFGRWRYLSLRDRKQLA